MADGRDIALMAHLMRRAGFGADREEIEALAEQGYEETVDQLLDPESQPALDQTLFYRYHPGAELGNFNEQASLNWMHRFRNTRRPLQEKMALFWHHVFATGSDKVGSALDMSIQVELFRTHGMGSFRNLLVELARNPAMVYWLDNQENHKRAPNENWGRELARALLHGRRQLHREGRVRVRPRLHGLEHRAKVGVHGLDGPGLAVHLPARGPRWRREVVPGPLWAARRRGCHRHHRSSSLRVTPSSPGTCTTSSWPTSRRCPGGPASRPGTRLPSGCSPTPSPIRTAR